MFTSNNIPFYLHELAVVSDFLGAGQPGVDGDGVPPVPVEAVALRAGAASLVSLPGRLGSVGAAITTSPLLLPAGPAFTAQLRGRFTVPGEREMSQH